MALACPKCKNKVIVDTRSQAAEKPAPAPAAEKAAEPAPAPKARPAPDMHEEAAEIGFFEEGKKLALVMAADPQEAEFIKQAVEELGYQYVPAENTRKAVSTMRLQHFDMVILSDGFDGVELRQSPVIQFMNHLSMSVRRRIFFALTGDDFKTMDNMMAFAMSVNMVINSADMEKVSQILKRGVSENERFYKVMMDTLVEVGRA